MRSSLALALFASTAVVAGCASTGVDQAGDVAADMRTIVVELDKGRAAIDNAIAALDGFNASGDLKTQFKTYSTRLDELESQSNRLKSLRTDLKAKEDAYVAAWQQRQALIPSPELRAKSEERKEQLAKRFTATSQKADETRTTYDAMFKQLRDVQKYLEHDLNSTGVAAIADTAKSAKKNSVEVKEGIAKVSEEVKKIADDIDVPPPPPPAPPAK